MDFFGFLDVHILQATNQNLFRGASPAPPGAPL